MPEFSFVVPGPPLSWKAPRVVQRGPTRLAIADPKVKQYQARVCAVAQAAGVTPIAGPVYLFVVMLFPRPKRLMRRKDPDGPVPMETKPDADNCSKAITDGLNGVAWADDKQVAHLEILKLHHEKRGAPRALVHVRSFHMYDFITECDRSALDVLDWDWTR